MKFLIGDFYVQKIHRNIALIKMRKVYYKLRMKIGVYLVDNNWEFII